MAVACSISGILAFALPIPIIIQRFQIEQECVLNRRSEADENTTENIHRDKLRSIFTTPMNNKWKYFIIFSFFSIFSRVKNDKVCEKFHLSKFEWHQSVMIINFIKMKLILVSIGAVLGEQCYEVVVLYVAIISSEI